MFDKIKMEIYEQLQTLFADVAVNKLAGDVQAYKADLDKIASVAEILGISTEITQVTINVKSSAAVCEVE